MIRWLGYQLESDRTRLQREGTARRRQAIAAVLRHLPGAPTRRGHRTAPPERATNIGASGGLSGGGWRW